MHTFIVILFFSLSGKILKRKLNSTTLTLSMLYILEATGFLLSVLFLFINTTLIGYILYLIATFLILFGVIFLVIFIISLLNIDEIFLLKKKYIIICSYGLIIVFSLFIPSAITLNESTNWKPVFSWFFLIILYLILTIYTFLPTLYLSIKLYRSFNDKRLRKKLKYFFIGIIGMLISLYGLILYNTWHDSIYRLIWGVLVFFIVFPSGILIYYGIGQNL